MYRLSEFNLGKLENNSINHERKVNQGSGFGKKARNCFSSCVLCGQTQQLPLNNYLLCIQLVS